ncbi:hypothetical protein PF005_g2989 [Phytophthora fragariae]|uniref:Uncharacterized protein n=1 Tax=Phytophthora fragariae TaxID=53985 RepID=A0A6A4AJJ7_9STRA|nr:hypothetical protein PF003_g8238 [Phytophthora fragariae]KAE8948570.1 hypothetical protein PF009_g1841 [Phytophthora fragariae]KAE9134009.1 hypothetical protein PF010_g2595 [Phytophthora fragariae]KAE9135141.1 hypothetical protein PF007_g2658 [Phytophthora fragariae]KAE9153749.1 hypothetical protein PF006_g2148 [Phytophthora fragariae]
MESKQQALDQVDPASELDKESEVSTRDGAVAFLESRGAVVKSKSPSNAALLKAGLKSNLSPAEATAQLRVLCRKFAALTEKVKEETKVREAAEREVRRLKALLDKDAAPVVASCRAETQAYVRELKETQEKLKRELRLEKEKNERVVAKALELEREKSALLASQSQQQTQANTRSQQDTSSGSLKHQSAWDKEQVYKIQSTLKLTIEELEEELSRKEEEVQTYRERSQRDRVRIKALEDEIRAKDDAQHAAQEARRQLEADLRQAQNDITNELDNMQRIHDQAQEDRTLRDTLEQQLVTLGEVNAALEQRSRALVRRLELSAAVTQECQDLKLQLRDAEVDNETLVHTIRNLKDEQFGREKDWKMRLESAKEEKAQVEQHVRELQEDLASLQAQNSLFSEWMLVRNENAIAARRDMPQDSEYPQQSQQSQPQAASPTAKRKSSSWHLEQDYDADYSSSSTYAYRDTTSTNLHGRRSASPRKSARNEDDDDSHYILSKTIVRSRPSTPASPRQSSSRKWQSANPLSPRGATRTRNMERSKVTPRSPRENMRRKMSTTSLSSVSSSATSITPSASSSSARDDHERLRKLMSRNRELQQRLQQETMATQNLEREITNMTS